MMGCCQVLILVAPVRRGFVHFSVVLRDMVCGRVPVEELLILGLNFCLLLTLRFVGELEMDLLMLTLHVKFVSFCYCSFGSS